MHMDSFFAITGPRVWNSQLLRFCATRNPDGTVLGDPAELDFTEMIQDHFGWEPPKERTQFDLLPLVVQVCAHVRRWRGSLEASHRDVLYVLLCCSSTRTRRPRCMRYRTRTARSCRCIIRSTSGSPTWGSDGTASLLLAVSRYAAPRTYHLVPYTILTSPSPSPTGVCRRAAVHRSAVQRVVLVHGNREEFDRRKQVCACGCIHLPVRVSTHLNVADPYM